MQHIMLRPLALGSSAAPLQAAYGSAISIQDASGLAAAHPHLRLTCTHGPGRSFADTGEARPYEYD